MGTPLKKTFSTLLVSLVFGSLGLPRAKAANIDGKRWELFDISTEPKPADWQYFHHLTQTERRELWRYQENRGKELKDWSWGWRMGWIRACTLNGEKYCHKILEAALFDKAMVVRAQAASALGEKYEKTGNAAAIALLDKAYQNPLNNRHGKPLFVQYRILFAIRQIGGEASEKIGLRLTKSGPETATYWNNIAKM